MWLVQLRLGPLEYLHFSPIETSDHGIPPAGLLTGLFASANIYPLLVTDSGPRLQICDLKLSAGVQSLRPRSRRRAPECAFARRTNQLEKESVTVQYTEVDFSILRSHTVDIDGLRK